MAIITQKGRSVKSGEEVKEVWRQKKTASAEVAERLFLIGQQRRAYRMKDCARFLTMKYCPDCGRSAGSSATLCRDRLCPTCEWRLSLKRYAQMVQTLGKVADIEDYHAMFLTLTVRNCRGSTLRETIGRMSEAWNRMLQKRPVKRCVAGWARSLEITYNTERADFHPHYHVILLIDPECDLSFGELQVNFNEWWRTAARLDYRPITDIRTITNIIPEAGNDKLKNAITETFKYAIKDNTLVNMPLTDFARYVQAVEGKRMVAYGGIIKEARRLLDIDDDELTDEDERSNDICAHCGAGLISEVLEWSFSEKAYKRMKEIITA